MAKPARRHLRPPGTALTLTPEHIRDLPRDAATSGEADERLARSSMQVSGHHVGRPFPQQEQQHRGGAGVMRRGRAAGGER